MHHRTFEKDKTIALNESTGSFNKQSSQISYKATVELNKWLKEIPKACRNINLPKVDFVIYTDASQNGWGATDGNNPTRWKVARKLRESH